jgi:hypothetical protein
MADVMTLRDLVRNIAVSLTSLTATVVIGHVIFETSSDHFGNSNSLFGLCFFLLCVTFLGIGYFATRLLALQSALAWFVGSFIVTMVDYLPAIYPGLSHHEWTRAFFISFTRDQLVPIAMACVLTYVGAWVRNRVNKRQDRNRNATSC